MIIVPAHAVYIHPQVHYFWEMEVDALVRDYELTRAALGPPMVQLQDDGRATLFCVGPGDVYLAYDLGTDGWSPKVRH